MWTGDRRAWVRFDVIGRLQGSIKTVDLCRVRDISRTGVLVETPWPLPLGSVQVAKLDIGSQSTWAAVRVRRVCAVPPDSVDPEYYLAGLEFVDEDSPLFDRIRELTDTGDVGGATPGSRS